MKARKILAALVTLAAGWTVLQSGCTDLGGYGYNYGYYPAYGLYDPTNDIQSVISYRQDVMDWSNDAWDAYIRE